MNHEQINLHVKNTLSNLENIDQLNIEDYKKIKKELHEDKDTFLYFYQKFLDLDKENRKSNPNNNLQKNIDELFELGVTKIEKFVEQDQIEFIDKYLDVIHNSISPTQYISGYVNLLPRNITQELFNEYWESIFTDKKQKNLVFSPALPNDGQVRIQSKNFNGLHCPATLRIFNNKKLKQVFDAYYLQDCNITSKVCRSNLEWIHPSPINHNPWHRDVLTKQLKAMILLNDVDEYSAPMMYAKKSHILNTEFDKSHLHNMFNWPQKTEGKKHTDDWGSDHKGYITNEFAPNDIDPKKRNSNDKIIIGQHEYELFPCTGKAGDIIFFESCGLHSGSRAHSSSRQNLVIEAGETSTATAQFKFFNLMK